MSIILLICPILTFYNIIQKMDTEMKFLFISLCCFFWSGFTVLSSIKKGVVVSDLKRRLRHHFSCYFYLPLSETNCCCSGMVDSSAVRSCNGTF